MRHLRLDRIGYYGRSVTELSREELLAAIAELSVMLKECRCRNEKCKELLGEERYRRIDEEVS